MVSCMSYDTPQMDTVGFQIYEKCCGPKQIGVEWLINIVIY